MEMQRTAKQWKKLIKEMPERKEGFKKKFKDMKVKKWKAIRSLMKSGSDFLTASRGAGKIFLFLIFFRICSEGWN